MLPVINLDDENFNDIFKRARNMISNIYPEWTDYNEHDPGITFLELFSWLKEMQQYHMNKIGNSQYLKYLKLLGIKQKRMKPAKAFVFVKHSKESYALYKESRLVAGNIYFETDKAEYIENSNIVKGLSINSNQKQINSFEYNQYLLEGRMRFYMFGQNPKKGDMFYIGFDKPLLKDNAHEVFFDIFTDYDIKRNPIYGDEFVPLAKFKLQVYTDLGWKDLNVTKDTTNVFIQTGEIEFDLIYDMKIFEKEEYDNKYYIRIILLEADYDIPPLLQGINLNVLTVLQQETIITNEDCTIENIDSSGNFIVKINSRLAICGQHILFLKKEDNYMLLNYNTVVDYNINRENDYLKIISNSDKEISCKDILKLVSYDNNSNITVLWYGNGLPNQKIKLNDKNILYDSIDIMVEDELLDNVFYLWKKVDSFDESHPEDRHFIFDDREGIIYFGDCEHARVPEKRIYIIGLKRSYGIDGNVKSGSINKLCDMPFEIELININNAFGGRNKEEINDCFIRFKKELLKLERAVTYEDYENIVRNTPGLMIENVKAIDITKFKKRDGTIDENSIYIVVKPFSLEDKKQLSNSYYKNIYNMLNSSRLIGTKINILSPEYIGISIYIEVLAKPYYFNAKEMVENIINNYFVASNFIFGSTILYSDIYGVLDTIKCVISVEALTIDAYGRGCSRNINGDIVLPPNGLAYLKEKQILITYI